MKRILVLLIVLMFATLACQAGTAPLTALPAPATQPPVPISVPVTNPQAQQDALVNLYQRVNPGIVAIKVMSQDGSSSLGSGFVYDSEGDIVTNDHVVTGAKNNKVEVDFMSGYKTYGTIIGTDLDSDLAVIKVNAPATELYPLTLGDSSTLKVGQTVIAIGNPFGLNGTMTVGVISALGRTLDSERTTGGGQPFTAGDIIQTDAAINPGNSGGPLFNLSGQVIGVNRAIRTTSSTAAGEPVNSGIGFAISSNIIKRVMPVLIKDGKYDYPYIGMSSLSGLSLDEIQALGLKTYTGAYVTSVVKGGPAERAGLKAGDQATSIQGLNAGGDLIVAIDGRPVLVFDDLLAYLITNKSPGDTVVLTVLRGDQKADITVTLDKRP
ncbi:MAG: trypsin-like peptidase domain-containing protein [Chloroflexi bacterium]|nr:trypsin-like peptidase domain-containing protein [Chloroflexota bacterium]